MGNIMILYSVGGMFGATMQCVKEICSEDGVPSTVANATTGL